MSDKKDVFFFLGGGIEHNETPEETIKRETIEEAGLSLKNITYFDRVRTYYFSQKNGYEERDVFCFVAKFDKQVAVPIEKDHKLIWLNPLDLKDKLYREYQRYWLSKYLKLKNGD